MGSKRRIFILLCLAHITISFNLAAIAAVIPSMGRDLGIPAVQVARIIPHYLWAYGLGALIYAPLTRFFSIRRLLILSIGIFSATSLYCGVTKSLSGLLLANFINGLAASSVVPLALMTIGKFFDPQERGRTVGAFFSASFISSLIGVLVSGLNHWSFLFIIPCVLGIITIISILIIKVDQLAHPLGRAIHYIKALGHRAVKRVFILIFVMSFLYHGLYKWYGVYFDQEYHWNQWMISSLILVTSVSGALGQMAGGVLTDCKGRYFTIIWGLGLLAMACCLLAGRYPWPVVAMILAVISAGWTVAHNGISTVLTDFPDGVRSELASLNSSIRFLSGGLGFYLSGFLVAYSFALNFFVIAITMLMLLLFIRFFIPGPHHIERT